MENILDDDFAQSPNTSLTDWSTFVGTPHDKYYIQKWLDLKESGKYSLNIGAFFFGILWMLYRKMYIESVILLGFFIIEGVIEELLLTQFGDTTTFTVFSKVVNIAVSVVVGLMGNKLYLNHTNRKINAIKNENYPDATYQQQLKERGGTSMLAVFIGLLIFILAFVGLYMVLDMTA